MTIRRVDPMSAAKIAGSLYAVLGFVVGAAISAFSTLLSAFAGPAFQLGGGPWRMMFGGAAIVGVPIACGVAAFLCALAGAALYNWLAGLVGGIVIEGG
jgi:hypothetical protein